MPGDVINLRQRRKALSRAAERQRADENAARHGQSKSVTRLDDARREKAERELAGHQLDETE
ncbi:MAG: DUF4169 family protein [Pseudomonadota bacterium]